MTAGGIPPRDAVKPGMIRLAGLAFFSAAAMMFAGCGDDGATPSPPDGSEDVTVSVALCDFPAAPDTVFLFAGDAAPAAPVVRDGADTIHVDLPLPAYRPQILVLFDEDYVNYGAAIFTGLEPGIILGAASTAETPIAIAPDLWSNFPLDLHEALVAIRNHPDYGAMVDLVKGNLAAAAMHDAMNDPGIETLGGRIVVETAISAPVRVSGAGAPAALGSVTLTNPDDAGVAGVAIEGNFGISVVDLAAVPVTIANKLPRYLIPCLVGYQVGSAEPEPSRRMAVGYIEPGSPNHYSYTEGYVDFETDNLERVDLVFSSIAGKGDVDPSTICWSEEDRWFVFRNFMARSFAYYFGLSFSFYAGWIEQALTTTISLTPYILEMDQAVEAQSYADIQRVYNEFAEAVALEIPVPGAGWQIVRFGKGLAESFTWTDQVMMLNQAPQQVTFTLTAERNPDIPGDDEPGPLGWELSWGDRGTTYFNYSYRIGQILSGDRLGLSFAANSLLGRPAAFVIINGISEIATDVAEAVSLMTVDFGVGEEGEIYSPGDLCPSDDVPTSAAWVTFTLLEMPQGLMPGLASGYFTGDLQVYYTDPFDMSKCWSESIVLVDAPFDSVRFYAEP